MPVNAFLARWNGGWAERVDTTSSTAYGRTEATLGLGALASLDEVYRVCDGQLAEFADPRLSSEATIMAIATTDDAYFAFDVGDTLTVPDNTGTPTGQRLQSITIAEDDETGRAQVSVALNTVIIPEEARLMQSVKKMVNGTLGGRSKVAQPVALSASLRRTTGGPRTAVQFPHWGPFFANGTTSNNVSFAQSSDEASHGVIWDVILMAKRTGGLDDLNNPPTLSHAAFSAPVTLGLVAAVTDPYAIYSGRLPVVVNGGTASAVTFDISREYVGYAIQVRGKTLSFYDDFLFDDGTSPVTSHTMDWAANLPLLDTDGWLHFELSEATGVVNYPHFVSLPTPVGDQSWNASHQGPTGDITTSGWEGFIYNSPAIAEPQTRWPITSTITTYSGAARNVIGYAVRYR